MGAPGGTRSRRSSPWTCMRRVTRRPTSGVITPRCQIQAGPEPPPWFKYRITRNASRSQKPRVENAGSSRTSEPGDQLGDDLLHDLAGTATDGEQPRIAERARHRRLHHVAHSTVELLAVVDDPLHQIAGKELRHADLLYCRLLARVEIAGAVGEPARRLDAGEVLHEAVAPDLEFRQRLAERAPLVAVAQRFFHQVLHARDGADRRHQALALEVGHDVVETLVLLPEEEAGGDPAVLEEEQRGVGRQVSDLRE